MISRAFIELLNRDLYLFRFDYFKAIINSMIWLFCQVIVSNYIMSAMGMGGKYGVFMLAGSIASVSLFRSINTIPILLNDIEGEGAISYYLTLPLKQYLVFVRYALSFAINGAINTISVLILSKLLMWPVLDLSNFSILKYAIIFVITHLFIGFLTLLIAAYTPSMRYFENVWSRIVFPMWFLGCFQFNWLVLYKQLPTLAYISLLNPLTYVLEANRVAFLGQTGYLNFWVCCLVLIWFIMIAAYFGIRKFMRRLDCIC